MTRSRPSARFRPIRLERLELYGRARPDHRRQVPAEPRSTRAGRCHARHAADRRAATARSARHRSRALVRRSPRCDPAALPLAELSACALNEGSLKLTEHAQGHRSVVRARRNPAPPSPRSPRTFHTVSADSARRYRDPRQDVVERAYIAFDALMLWASCRSPGGRSTARDWGPCEPLPSEPRPRRRLLFDMRPRARRERQLPRQ